MSRRGIGLLLTLSVAVAGSFAAGPALAAEPKVRMAIQYGFPYLPVVIMVEQRLVEKRISNAVVDLKQLVSGAAIREAAIAGELDVGLMGVAPFLVGAGKGVKWKILAGVSDYPYVLNVNKPLRSLKDLGPNDKIAHPAPTSHQHIIFQMAVEREFGNPKALEGNLVTMAHPTAMAALLGRRDVVGHLANPPFSILELEEKGIHRVFDSYQVMGGSHTSIVAVATERWYGQDRALVRAWTDAFTEAIEFIKGNPAEAAAIYKRAAKAKEPAEKLADLLGRKDVIDFAMTPTGIMALARFMKKIQLVPEVPASWKDYAFEHLHRLPGS
jgi:NitT/TauT family transport system substrate-binding protein